jgi:hypothetical protein
MAGASHGGLTFALTDLGGGVYTAFFRTRDFGTVISCVFGLCWRNRSWLGGAAQLTAFRPGYGHYPLVFNDVG